MFLKTRSMCAGRLAGFVPLLIVLSSAASSTPAQAAEAQAGGATIRGTIQDESGAVLPGVTVTARNLETGRTRSTVSDVRGNYEINRLDAGDYEVQGVMTGFRGQAVTVTVAQGTTQTGDVVLEIAPFAETVTVMRTDQDLSAVPQSVAVVERDQIEYAQRRASLDEALRGIPGLFVQNRRNYGLSGGIGLSIRAPQPRFGLRGLAIIQDGIPITTADGTTEPGNVDLGSVGRIDVVRGPSSVLYGNSAGGVINLTTTFDTSRPLTITPDIQFGSNGYNRQQVRVEGGNAGTQFMASVSRFETDGFRDHSAAEITQANVVVHRELSARTEIRGVFNLYDAPFAESPSFVNEDDARNNPTKARPQAAHFSETNPVGRNWGEGTNQGQYGLTVEHRFSDAQLFRGHRVGHVAELGSHGCVPDDRAGQERVRVPVGVCRRDPGLVGGGRGGGGSRHLVAERRPAGIRTGYSHRVLREVDQRGATGRPDRGCALRRAVRAGHHCPERPRAVHRRGPVGLLRFPGR